MNIDSLSIQIIYIALLNFLVGILILTFGHRFARKGEWIVFSGFFLQLVISVFLFVEVLRQPGSLFSHYWGSLGEGLKEEGFSLGLWIDPAGLLMVMLATFAGFALLLNRAFIEEKLKKENVLSALSISLAGLVCVWTAGSPWTGLLGISLVIVGAFQSLGSRWSETNAEALFASNLIQHQSLGLILALAGTCMLAACDVPLVWTNQVYPEPSLKIQVACAFLFSGLFVLFRPFPILSWATSPVRGFFPAQILLSQLFPSLAAFFFFYRFEPYFKFFDVSTLFSGLCHAVLLLTVVPGVFQKDWRNSFFFWQASAFSLAACILLSSGQESGWAWVFGSFLGSFSFCLAGNLATEESLNHPPQDSKQKDQDSGNAWVAFAVVFSLAASVGWFGLISGFGVIRWFEKIESNMVLAVLSAWALFMMAFLFWKMCLFILASLRRRKAQLRWTWILAPYLLLVFAFGVWWDGTLTGGFISSGTDRVFGSLIERWSGKTWQVEEAAYFKALAFCLLPQFLAFLCAYFFRSSWENIAAQPSRFVRFFLEAYFLDRFLKRVFGILIGFGDFLEWVLRVRLWETHFQQKISGALHALSSWMVLQLNQKGQRVGVLTRRGFDVSGKALQLVQNGDVQWYLFFAVAISIAVLVHFLKDFLV